MTKRKLVSPVYTHLQCVLNRALPLEYAIRAMMLHEPEVFKELELIGREIHSFWSGRGWSSEEIAHNEIADISWDALQSASSLVRNHGRLYSHADEMREGVEKVCRLFINRVNTIESAFLDHFRACDLVSGNNIPELLRQVSRSIREAIKHGNAPETPISSFLSGVREAVRLNQMVGIAPGRFINRHGEGRDALLLALPFGINLDELKEGLDEFLYRYAIDREGRSTPSNTVSQEILGGILKAELRVLPRHAAVATYQMAMGPLRGLLCWDLRKKYFDQGDAAPRKQAAADAAKLYGTLIPSERRPSQDTFLDDIKKTDFEIKAALNKVLKRPATV